MTPSSEIYRYIARKEGFVPVSYQDGADFSIGFGHRSPFVKFAKPLTLDTARWLLVQDLTERSDMVNKWLKVTVTQPQFDALLSSSFNAGSKLAAVIYFINNGQPEKAMGLLQSFCWLNSKINPGLQMRRDQEVAIFEHGDYGDISQFRVYDGVPGPDNFKLIPFPIDFP